MEHILQAAGSEKQGRLPPHIRRISPQAIGRIGSQVRKRYTY
jgi:hypothetical protein